MPEKLSNFERGSIALVGIVGGTIKISDSPMEDCVACLSIGEEEIHLHADTVEHLIHFLQVQYSPERIKQ